MKLLVGTYSLSLGGMDGNGEGIYSVSFDGETGEFGIAKLAATCTNPSSLVLSPDRQMLFAGREVFAPDGPALISFKVTDTGELTAMPALPLTGELPCHLAYDPVNNRLASAQYWTGDVALSFVVHNALQPPTYLTRKGHGPNAARQEGPHAHFVAFTDGGTVLHLVDLGTDCIMSYRLGADGDVSAVGFVKTPAGAGPRHMVVNRAETRAWVLCELDENLITLSRDGLSWVIDGIRPGFDAPVSDDGAGGTIRLCPDEAFVYISGRRQSQIAAFKTDGTKVGAFDCGGDCPREFIVTPDGNWVISANQMSNTLTSLHRDQETGVLMRTNHSCAIGSPAALVVV